MTKSIACRVVCTSDEREAGLAGREGRRDGRKTIRPMGHIGSALAWRC